MKIDHIIRTTEGMLQLLRSLHLVEPSRRGGYLTVLQKDHRTVEPVLVARIGHVRQKNSSSCRDDSMAKADTLSESDDHISSFPPKGGFDADMGGAIYAGSYIFAFSGLADQHEDETLMIAVALSLNIITVERAEQTAAVSRNHCFVNLMDKLGELLKAKDSIFL